jgi:hypothetical protein
MRSVSRPPRDRLALAALLVAGACGGTTPEEYAAVVEAATPCEAGDRCVLFIPACGCPVAVSYASIDEVKDAADGLDCDGVAYDCVAVGEPRCEAGRCTADPPGFD